MHTTRDDAMRIAADADFDRLLAAPRPRAGSAEAEAIALRIFGVAGRAEPLPSERDLNFHIRRDDGCGWVLKIGNAVEDPNVPVMQNAALRRIAARDPSLPIPRVVRARDGRDEASVLLDGGTRNVVRLLTFLPGQPFDEALASVTQAASLGRSLARISLALEGFAHAAASHVLLWDLQHAARLRALLPQVSGPHLRAAAERVLVRHADEILPRMARFRRQVVHNDFNPHNLLLDPDDPSRVAGVLDFGDMVETPLVNDVAVAASYQVGRDGGFDRVAALVGAYHAASPLRREEVELLPDLVAVRFALSVVIPEWRAALQPENGAYILRNRPRAAAALAAFDRAAAERACAALLAACHLE